MEVDPRFMWAWEQANRLGVCYPGRSIDDGHIARWTEELIELGQDLATDVVTRASRDYASPPSVAELLAVVAEVRSEQRPVRPELPEHHWTEEDEEAAIRAGRDAFAEVRERWKRGPETPAEAVVVVVGEPEPREDPAVLEQRRREQLTELEQRYASELAEQTERRAERARARADFEGVGL